MKSSTLLYVRLIKFWRVFIVLMNYSVSYFKIFHHIPKKKNLNGNEEMASMIFIVPKVCNNLLLDSLFSLKYDLNWRIWICLNSEEYEFMYHLYIYDIMVSDNFHVDYLKFQGPFKPKLLIIFSPQNIPLI
jgi:hypothetical protein